MGRGAWLSGIRVFLPALFVLEWAAAPDLAAQRPLSVLPQRDLNFGDLLAGVPKLVSRLDPANSGLLEVRGQPRGDVLFTFTLPPALVSTGGETLPVEFGADDGGFAQVPDQSASVGFDPRVSYTNTLSRAGRAFLWLGGTARASPAQSAGSYQATVTLTVAYTGN